MATPTIVVPGVVSGTPVSVLSASIVGDQTTGTQSATNAAIVTGGSSGTLSVTIPASTRVRTAVVFAALQLKSGNLHSNFALGLDVGNAPANASTTFQSRNISADSDSEMVQITAGGTFTIPGDNASHVIAGYTVAQGSTNSSTIGALSTWLSAVVVG